MGKLIQLAREHRLLAGILLLGAVLRCIGLSWGIPTAAVPHLLSHFDEDTVMSSLAQVDLKQGDWNPDWGHNEGPLNYFIWVGLTAAMKGLGIIEHMPNELQGCGDPDYFRIVLAGRFSTVCFDVCAILFIYLIVLKMARSKPAALFGALLFALFPFEIMHCHYMRPHVLGNLFVCLVIYASLFILGAGERLRVYVAVGLILGLATVTRYNLLPVGIIPYAMFLYKRFTQDAARFTPKYILASLFHYKMVIVGVAFVVGVLVGDWPLLVDFESVRGPLQYQLGTSAFGPATLANLFDFTMPLKYVTSVIPDGAFLLWVVLYAGVVYAAFLPHLRRFTLPLALFIGPYLYYVTKGYGLIAVRPVMPLFPPLIILAALAFDDVVKRTRQAPVARYALSAGLGFVLIATFLFDVACVTSMADRPADPFVQVHDYFAAPGVPDDLRIGFRGIYWERYHSRNFAQILNAIPGKTAIVDGANLNYSEHPQDYILVFDFDDTMAESTKNELAALTASHEYVLEQVFKKRLGFGNVEFDYANMPTDFRYAYPVIYLLKSKSSH